MLLRISLDHDHGSRCMEESTNHKSSMELEFELSKVNVSDEEESLEMKIEEDGWKVVCSSISPLTLIQ